MNRRQFNCPILSLCVCMYVCVCVCVKVGEMVAGLCNQEQRESERESQSEGAVNASLLGQGPSRIWKSNLQKVDTKKKSPLNILPPTRKPTTVPTLPPRADFSPEDPAMNRWPAGHSYSRPKYVLACGRASASESACLSAESFEVEWEGDKEREMLEVERRRWEKTNCK